VPLAPLSVIGMILLERFTKVPRWLVELGAASYALYLVHSLAAPSVPEVMARIGLGNPHLGLLAILVSMPIMSLFVYWWVEKPITAWCRRRWDKPKAALPPVDGALVPAEAVDHGEHHGGHQG
jgi:peptidoglycan/LPS O-acetylase OafA/YrhL